MLLSVTNDSGAEGANFGLLIAGNTQYQQCLSLTYLLHNIYYMLYAGIYVSPECEAVTLQQFVLIRLQLAARHRVGALLHFYAGNISPPRTDMIFTQTNLFRWDNIWIV